MMLPIAHERSAASILPKLGKCQEPWKHDTVLSFLLLKLRSNECKRRKIKCNGLTPCQRCGRQEIECIYVENAHSDPPSEQE